MRMMHGFGGTNRWKNLWENHGETGIPWGKLWENHGETIIPPLNSLSFHVFPRVLLIAKFMNSHSMSYLFVKNNLMFATELHFFHFFPAESSCISARVRKAMPNKKLASEKHQKNYPLSRNNHHKPKTSPCELKQLS